MKRQIALGFPMLYYGGSLRYDRLLSLLVHLFLLVDKFHGFDLHLPRLAHWASRLIRHFSLETRCKCHKRTTKSVFVVSYNQQVCQLRPTLVRKRTHGQHISNVLRGVHVLNLNGCIKIGAIKQPIKIHSVGSGKRVSCWRSGL